MVVRIEDSVYKVASDSNVYLIMKPEVMVIDTSDAKYRDLIKEEIEKVISLRGLTLGDVKKVILTHLHYDHCGNVDLFPNAEVFVSKEDLEDFKKDRSGFFCEGLSDTSVEMIEGASVLGDEVGGLKVLKSPGHTRGSVALLDEKHGLLFSGDTLFFNGGIGRTDFVVSVPGKMDGSVEKLSRLVKEDALMLCPGHDY